MTGEAAEPGLATATASVTATATATATASSTAYATATATATVRDVIMLSSGLCMTRRWSNPNEVRVFF